MLDAHCHIDLYPNPTQIAMDAERAGVFTVLVTNLPSGFEAAYPNIRPFKKIRLALGLHPLNAPLHRDNERQLFQVLVNKTSFIGEIGLDFSPAGYKTRDAQIASFQFALRSLNRIPKFVTVHSRRAEMSVLELARQEYGMPIILHWYTGTNKIVDLALDAGHYFSVNPAMVESKRSRSIVQRIPRERVLTESDGPFVRVGTRVVVPADVRQVENALADMWNADSVEVRNIIDANFQRLIEPIRFDSLRPHVLRP